MNLQIYRNNEPHVLISIDKNTFFSHVVMGEHIISSSFIVQEPLDIDEGDYVIFRGEQFTINNPLPPFDKSSSINHKYDIIFEGYIYDLIYKVFRHLGSMEFSLFATARTLVGLIVDNMNENSSGWTVGEVDDTKEVMIEFYQDGKGFNCKSALAKGAEAHKLEFWLKGKTINMTEHAGVLTNLDFEQGRGKGLYTISRGEIADHFFFNRIYGQGSTMNIHSTYRGGAKRLMLPQGYLEVPIAPGKRRKEVSVILDDIFPKRTGTVTAVGASYLKITDTSIDFDLIKVDGVTPQISFVTGSVAGKDYEIDSYNTATKTITIKPFTDSDGAVSPNATFDIKPGDKYILLGIVMPEQYFTSAEEELRVELKKLLDKATRSTPPYSVKIDPKYMRDNGIIVNAGDRARLKDSQHKVDRMIRIYSVKFPVVEPDELDVVLSDDVVYLSEEKQIVEADKIKKEVTIVNRTNIERARRNWKATNELTTMLNTVKAEMLLIMVDGGQYTTTVVSSVDKDTFKTSAGTLHHELYAENNGLWNIDAYDEVIPTEDPYYVYIKANKVQNIAEIVLSLTQIGVDSEVGYYHLPFGVISSIFDNNRVFSSTKGYTSITGGNIRTGRILSNDGLSWIDLNTGEIRGNFTFTNGDSVEDSVNNITEKTSFLETQIDGNVVATGTLIVGDAVGNNNAGITGVIDEEEESVRFWAGANYVNKGIAPWRVLNDGSFYSTKGSISGFTISDGQLTADLGMPGVGETKGKLELISGVNPEIKINNRFKNNNGQVFTTFGVRLHGSGADVRDLNVTGEFDFSGVLKKDGSVLPSGQIGYTKISGTPGQITVVNGLITGWG